LIGHVHLDRLRIRWWYGERRVDALPIDLLFAEELVAVRQALGKNQCTDRLRAAGRLDLDALLVEVVTVGDAPVELKVVSDSASRVSSEGLVDVEIFFFALEPACGC
jgi:hypothetical protein